MACRRRRPRKVPTRSGPLRECSQKSSSSQRTSKPRRSHGLYPDAARDVHNCPTPAEEAISTAEPSGHGKVAAWVYSEAFVPEDEVLLRARERASELGCPAVLPGVGAVLRVLAAATKAHAVVEVGTGAGVAALWLLRGMPYDGQLTTIDREVEHQRAARAAFAEDGVAPQRTRIIPGRPGDVLPRLADGAYDLVLVASDPLGYPEYVDEALRLLRPGGVLAIDGALLRDRVADPARRDELTTVVREVGRTLRNDERVLPAMLPSGDGLLLAVRR